MSETPALRVFISYSHDDRGHADRVAALSARFRQDGIDCRIDQYEASPAQGWPVWMRRQIDEADTVLVICTKTYRERFERKQISRTGRGVRWESVLMENQFYRDGAVSDKLLPVIFHPDDEEHIPDMLSGLSRGCVDPDNLDQADGYQELLRLIHCKPTREMPPLGPSMRTLSVQEQFFKSDELAVETHALPVTGPDLFGRDEQLRQLDEAWANEHTHVISLVAFGGVGKSALVNHWLGKLAAEDYRGARRVYGWSAYSQGSKQRATAADLFIVQALRFFGDDDPEAGPIDQRAQRLANLIRRQPTLLVLDGIESLQFAPGEGEGHIDDGRRQDEHLRIHQRRGDPESHHGSKRGARRQQRRHDGDDAHRTEGRDGAESRRQQDGHNRAPAQHPCHLAIGAGRRDGGGEHHREQEVGSDEGERAGREGDATPRLGRHGDGEGGERQTDCQQHPVEAGESRNRLRSGGA